METELAGEKIVTILTKAPGSANSIGGIKVVAESGWFAARPSGTEDIYKLYAASSKVRSTSGEFNRRRGESSSVRSAWPPEA